MTRKNISNSSINSNLSWLFGKWCRNLIQASALITLMLFVLSFNQQSDYQIKKTTAEATTIEGLVVFTDCRPISQNDYLGTVKSNTGGFGNAQYEGVRARLIKKVKQEYPNADGIIIYANSGQVDRADAIKIK